MELHPQLVLPLRLWDGCGLLRRLLRPLRTGGDQIGQGGRGWGARSGTNLTYCTVTQGREVGGGESQRRVGVPAWREKRN
jgi:hypothetical protein